MDFNKQDPLFRKLFTDLIEGEKKRVLTLQLFKMGWCWLVCDCAEYEAKQAESSSTTTTTTTTSTTEGGSETPDLAEGQAQQVVEQQEKQQQQKQGVNSICSDMAMLVLLIGVAIGVFFLMYYQ